MKHWKKIAALLLALCMILALAGCSRKPTAEDAEKYVDAVLSLLCTGEYDQSVNIEDADELGSVMDEAIAEVLNQASDGVEISEQTKADFTEVMHEMFAHSNYTVGKATPADDGFDVPVTVRPLLVGDEVDEAMNAGMEELMSSTDISQMSTEELTDSVIQLMVDAFKVVLEDPQYGEETTVTVHYGLLDEDNNIYGVSEADGEKIGSVLFSMG